MIFFTPTHSRTRRPALAFGLLMLGTILSLQAGAQTTAVASNSAPSQSPLLINPNGAKPNMMITLDNSGSMAFPYNETYDLDGGSTNAAAAMRSADLNPIYYDPRITYPQRVNSDGTNLTPTDGWVFVSNANSAGPLAGVSFSHSVRRNTTTQELFSVTNRIVNDRSTTGTASAGYTLTGYATVPPHRTHQNLPRATNADTGLPETGETFTYSYCRTSLDAAPVVTTNTSGNQTGCPSVITRTVTYNGTDTFELPADHKRTECTAVSTTSGRKFCTTAQETANILTWFRYHSNRNKAAATAIGRALTNPKFDSLLRIGYMNTSRYKPSANNDVIMDLVPGTDIDPAWLRGVRMHLKDSTDTVAFYNWLYNHVVIGGTPLHNSVDRTASYYSVGNSAVENPWATNPATLANATTNPEMSCRRSFNVLFSDGAWNATTSTNTTASTENQDYQNGSTFSLLSPLGTLLKSFQFKRDGDKATEAGRASYTPYGGSGTRGLADLTARYFWNTDLRTSLADKINTRAGQPTFWQNMTTYTVGYLIKPSGEVPGATSGLTFAQIDNYKSQYADFARTSFTSPSWPTGNLDSSSTDDAKRIDDFIQAGYTAGGRGFSVQSSTDVEKVFNIIVADILSASGNDAGVAVNDSSSDSTSSGSLKYLVSYGTLENKGEITAVKLDAKGSVIKNAAGEQDVAWTANSQIPTHNLRKVYTISDVVTGGNDFSGSFNLLPSDVKASLAYGTDAARVPTSNSNFVDYLRGNNAATDSTGKLFRQRVSKLGAMVNPPSVYVGGGNDLKYDQEGDVSGASAYQSYYFKKADWPASLYVATNAGMVHAMNAATGMELGAFFPRRSMKHMLSNAKDDYSFSYVLDGRLSEHDIYDSATSSWKHIVMGTGGRGEKLIYGLNVPFKGTGTTATRIPEKADYLWETGPTNGPQGGTSTETAVVDTANFVLGYTTNGLQSGQTKGVAPTVAGVTAYTEQEWVALVNSGHFNGQSAGAVLKSQPDEKAHGLLVLNPISGAVIKRIPLPASYSAGRGLSGVIPVRDATGHIVAAYAGDAKGNLWRFNLMGAPSDWNVSYDKPIFTTQDNRPIYGAPMWRPHPEGGAMVVFATGMLLNDTDIGDTAANTSFGTANKESIYGIWDPTTPGDAVNPVHTAALPRLYSKLIEQRRDTTVSILKPSGTDREFSRTTSNPVDWTTDHGWRFELGSTKIGERSIADATYVGRNVFIATTVVARPATTAAETCSASDLPANFIYGLRALTGGNAAAFDADGDGVLDNVSIMDAPSGGFSQGLVFQNKAEDDEVSINCDASGANCTKRKRPKKRFTGEPDLKDKCNQSTVIQGVADTGAAAGSICVVSDWSRTQYQLNSPPSN